MSRRTRGRIWFPLATAAFAVAGLAWAQDKPAAPPPKYVGANKCKSCHQSKASGNAYGQWQESKHSKTFEVLASPAALELAKAKGIAKPQEDAACLKCHVTGHGERAERFDKTFDPKTGISCETCHGPGSAHASARLKAALGKKPAEGAVEKLPEGEIIGRPAAETCLTCHNAESPSFKGFCFRERVVAILHLDPRQQHDPAEVAALKCGCEAPCTCQKSECGGWPTPEEIAKAREAGKK